MKLVILGSGTCVPSLKRNASGYLIEASGMKILVRSVQNVSGWSSMIGEI